MQIELSKTKRASFQLCVFSLGLIWITNCVNFVFIYSLSFKIFMTLLPILDTIKTNCNVQYEWIKLKNSLLPLEEILKT